MAYPTVEGCKQSLLTCHPYCSQLSFRAFGVLIQYLFRYC